MRIPVAGITVHLFDTVKSDDSQRVIFDFIRVEDPSGHQDGVGVTFSSRFLSDEAPAESTAEPTADPAVEATAS